MMNKVVCSLNV